VTSHTYDSLSRRLTETTNGRTVHYQHDDAGNATQQLYPSGTNLTQSFDALNRLQAVTSGGAPQETYGFRGAEHVASKSLGNGLAGGTTYDPARRPTRATLGGSNFEPFTELLSWSPRNLKTAIQREDLNSQGYVVAYDDAGRLVEAAKTANPLVLAPNNSTPAAATVAALPDSFGFTYDAAENLSSSGRSASRSRRSRARPTARAGTGRACSPASRSPGTPTATSSARADHFAWDYRNASRASPATAWRDRALRIRRLQPPDDARGRRRDAELGLGGLAAARALRRRPAAAMRRIYGQGLDEVVRQEIDGMGMGRRRPRDGDDPGLRLDRQRGRHHR
jgi:hypothetical protein